MVEFIDANPGLAQSVRFIKSTKGNRIIATSVASGLHYMMARKDAELANQLFTGIYKGFPSEESESFVALREKLIACATSTTTTQPRVVAMFIIKAWNAKRKGARLRIFKFTDGEEIPRIK